MRDFSTDRIDSGHPADVIEAVAEGVIFNSLDLLLDTHINRMIVLRPKLSIKEKKEALTIAFALLGNDYDFKFDFNDVDHINAAPKLSTGLSMPVECVISHL
jgi:hypothetical protein